MCQDFLRMNYKTSAHIKESSRYLAGYSRSCILKQACPFLGKVGLPSFGTPPSPGELPPPLFGAPLFLGEVPPGAPGFGLVTVGFHRQLHFGHS